MAFKFVTFTSQIAKKQSVAAVLWGCFMSRCSQTEYLFATWLLGYFTHAGSPDESVCAIDGCGKTAKGHR